MGLYCTAEVGQGSRRIRGQEAGDSRRCALLRVVAQRGLPCKTEGKGEDKAGRMWSGGSRLRMHPAHATCSTCCP